MCGEDINRRGFLGATTALVAGLSAEAVLAAVPDKQDKTLLAIGAHLDDSEGCAGGLLLKAVQAGMRVVIVQANSDYSNHPLTRGREKEIEAGLKQLAKDMGMEKIFLGYKYHQVPDDLEIKKRLAQIVADVEPDIAVIMSEHDNWVDHVNIARAGKDALLFAHGYVNYRQKLPRLLLRYADSPSHAGPPYDFHPDTFVDTTDVADRVVEMINRLSQITYGGEPRIVAQLTLLKKGDPQNPLKMELTDYADLALAVRRYWGNACRVRYADAFESVLPRPQQLW
jgi:LmbE family N-acetylglucosaminyl deacetylase